MYRFAAERDDYDDREPEVQETRRQRVGKRLRSLSKESPLTAFVASAAILLTGLGILEALGFLFFHFEPLTSNGVPARLGTQLLVAPVISFMFLVLFLFALFLFVHFKDMVLFVIREMVEQGGNFLVFIAKKFDGKEPWDD
jgi:hypothetical protein